MSSLIVYLGGDGPAQVGPHVRPDVEERTAGDIRLVADRALHSTTGQGKRGGRYLLVFCTLVKSRRNGGLVSYFS